MATAALFPIARVFFAGAVDADFTCVTEHTRASVDTTSATTELSCGALFAGAWIVKTLAIHTGFASGALGCVRTLRCDALPADAKVACWAVTVTGAVVGANTLAVFAHLLGVGARDVETWIVLAGVLSVAYTTMLAYAGACAAAVFITATTDADLSGGAGFTSARIVHTLPIHTLGVSGAAHTGARLRASAIRDAAVFAITARVVGLARVAYTLGAQTNKVGGFAAWAFCVAA